MRQTLRASFWLFVTTLGLLAQPLQAQTPAGAVPVKTFTGYYNDTAVSFAAFETGSPDFAAANSLVYAPRLSQMNPASLPRMIFFMNVGAPQTVVLQTQPGQPDYSPLWRVVMAQWQGSTAMPLVSNYAMALQLNQQGNLQLQDTGIIFNGPVFMVNRSLSLQGGTLAPTISPNEFMGINPAIRTAYFQAHQGYYAGQPVAFLALEHAPGQISHAPGAIPVPTLSSNVLGSAGMASFYDVDGQAPVIDSVPIPQVAVTPAAPVTVSPTTPATPPANIYGAAGLTGKPTTVPQAAGQAGQTPTAAQGGAVSAAAQPGISQPASAPLYSPIWHVIRVTFNAGAPRPLLQSVQAIQQAMNSGWVTVVNGNPDDAFNCPVPFFYQSGSAAPIYTPPGVTTGGTATTPTTAPVTTNPAPITSTPMPSTGGGGIY